MVHNQHLIIFVEYIDKWKEVGEVEADVFRGPERAALECLYVELQETREGLNGQKVNWGELIS